LHGAILGGRGQVGVGHLAPETPGNDDLRVSVGEPEALISREEVAAMLFNIADIAAEAWLIRRLLEDADEEEEDQAGD
jgi:hypothetical protein